MSEFGWTMNCPTCSASPGQNCTSVTGKGADVFYRLPAHRPDCDNAPVVLSGELIEVCVADGYTWPCPAVTEGVES